MMTLRSVCQLAPVVVTGIRFSSRYFESYVGVGTFPSMAPCFNVLNSARHCNKGSRTASTPAKRELDSQLKTSKR